MSTLVDLNLCSAFDKNNVSKIKKIKSLRKERKNSAIIPSKTVIKPLVIFYRSIVQMTQKKIKKRNK